MMENQEVSDERVDLLVGDSVLSSSSFDGSKNAGGNDMAYVLVEDMDMYWDDLTARLTVSRMVSDAVIKGMVNAVVQEAAENVTSKEAEIAILNERLHHCELDAAKCSKCESPLSQVDLKGSTCEVQLSCLDLCIEQSHTNCLNHLKNTAEEQLQGLRNEIGSVRGSLSLSKANQILEATQLCGVLLQNKVPEILLKMDESVYSLSATLQLVYEQIGGIVCLFRDSVHDQQWRWEFQNEVNSIVVENYIQGLHEEFVTKFCEERNIYSNRNKIWLKRFDELSSLRKELDTINRSILNSEPGYLISQGSHENIEDGNTNDRKDNNFSRKILGSHSLPNPYHTQENGADTIEKPKKSSQEGSESPLLSHMSKEELIHYFKTEMSKMKRHHELALHEKTEELFMVKRELLNGKGSSPLKREREFEILRKRIPEFILKLDDILAENERFPMPQDDCDKFCSFKERIDNLLSENQRLKDLLADKRKEVKFLSSQISDAANQMSCHSSVETKYLKQIRKLRWDVDDAKIEAILSDEIHKIVLRDWIGKLKCQFDIPGMEAEISHEICTTILRGVVGDIRSSINAIIKRYDEDKKILEADLLQKDESLRLETEKAENLKHKIESLSKMMQENEKYAQEARSELVLQKEQFQVVYQELNMLKEQTSEKERLISKNHKESDLLQGRLQGAIDQVHQYEVEVVKLDEKLKVVLNDLREAEMQKAMLHEVIEEKEKRISSYVAEKRAQREEMKSLMFFVLKFSKAFDELESQLTENIQRNNSRLDKLKCQRHPILQQAESLQRELSWYKQNLEIKSCNLQKAEMEVDLLGDEVDALLSTLAKMYIALDHYSPVLQHYPGVMEILKLVRRELEGTAKTI